MSELPQTDRSPLPDVDAGSDPHWAGLARGVVVVRRCAVCGAHGHPVLETCRRCESPQLDWVDVGDVVRLYSWTVETRAVIQGMTPPYVVAQVVPDGLGLDDVRLVGTVLAEPVGLAIGMALRLEAALAPASKRPLAVYVPVEE